MILNSPEGEKREPEYSYFMPFYIVPVTLRDLGALPRRERERKSFRSPLDFPSVRARVPSWAKAVIAIAAPSRSPAEVRTPDTGLRSISGKSHSLNRSCLSLPNQESDRAI